MNFEVIKNSDNELKLKLIGLRHTIPQMLKNELLDNKEVEFVSYMLEHPEDDYSIFVIRTNKANPKDLLLKAIDNIEKQVKEFEEKTLKVLPKQKK